MAIERIPLSECEDRGIYMLRSRNLTMGVFRNNTQGFIGIREKFSSEYLFEEYHFDAGGTAHPYKIIGSLPTNIKNEESLGHICTNCGGLDTTFYVRYAEPILCRANYRQPGQWICLNCTNPSSAWRSNPLLQEFLESIRCPACYGAADQVWIPKDPENKWAEGEFGDCEECNGTGLAERGR